VLEGDAPALHITHCGVHFGDVPLGDGVASLSGVCGLVVAEGRTSESTDVARKSAGQVGASRPTWSRARHTHQRRRPRPRSRLSAGT
jgi:hypothetical protein